MQSPDVRASLEQCRTLLRSIQLPPELDALALDLLDHLIGLHAADRLTPAFLLLSLKAFEGVEALGPVVEPLAAIAGAEAAAQGHRDVKDRAGLPWVVSKYSPL